MLGGSWVVGWTRWVSAFQYMVSLQGVCCTTLDHYMALLTSEWQRACLEASSVVFVLFEASNGRYACKIYHVMMVSCCFQETSRNSFPSVGTSTGYPAIPYYDCWACVSTTSHLLGLAPLSGAVPARPDRGNQWRLKRGNCAGIL